MQECQSPRRSSSLSPSPDLCNPREPKVGDLQAARGPQLPRDEDVGCLEVSVHEGRGARVQSHEPVSDLRRAQVGGHAVA